MTHNIYFRGLDLSAITERYLSGGYQKQTKSLFVKKAVNTNTTKTVLITKQENEPKRNVFTYTDGKSYIRLGFMVYDLNGSYKPIDPNQRYNCMYCIREVDPLHKAGLPIRKIVENGVSYFHEIDIFCCWNCAYAEYRARSSNSLYTHTLTFLKELFVLTTGKTESELQPASDKRCLQIFNGPLTWEEFHAQSINFSTKPENVFYLPIIYYIGQDITQ